MPLASARSTPSDDEKQLLPTASSQVAPAHVSVDWFHFVLALAALLAIDYFLAAAASALRITFPSSLIGMFGLLSVLLGCDSCGFGALSATLFAAASPAIKFITRWLPLFYVPPLVVLPIAVQGFDASELARCALIVALGSAYRQARTRP